MGDEPGRQNRQDEHAGRVVERGPIEHVPERERPDVPVPGTLPGH